MADNGIRCRRENDTLVLPPMEEDALAQLVQALAARGAGVVGVATRTRSLEEIFLRLTEGKEVA